MPRSESSGRGPQRHTKRVLKSNDRDHVRPAQPGDDVRDRLPVDPAGRSNISQAPAFGSERGEQRPSDVLDNSSRRIAHSRVDPVIRISGVLTGGDRTAQPSRHRSALLTITVDYEGGYLASRWKWVMQVSEADTARIRAYHPRIPADQWERIRPLVMALVTAVVGRVPYGVDDLLYVATRVAQFADEAGLPPDPGTWLRNENIDRFTISRCADRHFGPSTALTYRTYLRRMREALVWVDRGEAPSPKLHVSDEPSAPYKLPELAAIDAWSDGLPVARRWDAKALLCLGAGCGLSRADFIAVTGRDVRVLNSGATLVTLASSGRVIACRARYEQLLQELVEARRGGYLFRPARQVAAAKNLVSNWTWRNIPPHGTPRLSLQRLRSTWIVSLMTDRVDRELIAVAAGLSSSAQLAKYSRWVPPITADAATRLLRGTAWD